MKQIIISLFLSFSIFVYGQVVLNYVKLKSKTKLNEKVIFINNWINHIF